MESSIKLLEQSILELTLSESAENLIKYRKNVLKILREHADIKGFRKGALIPEALLVKHYGEDRISEMIIEEALKHLYKKALHQHGVIPVSQGEVVEVISQSPLEVKLHVEILPEAQIDPSYKEIKIPKTLVIASMEEVEEELNGIKQRFTRYEEADIGYEAQMGDKLMIDTVGYDLAGNILETTQMQNYPLILGSKILVAGFEEGLVGKKASEVVDLEVTFPLDYHNPDFAGKQTKFTVTIHSIVKSTSPEFTPEFIKSIRGKDLDLDGLKDLIRQEIYERKESQARAQDEDTLIDKLIEISKVDYGKAVLDRKIQEFYQEVKSNIVQSGAKVSDYIESLGMDEEAYISKHIVPVARKRVIAEALLRKLHDLEKTEVEDSEVEAEIETIIARYGSPEVQQRLKARYTQGSEAYKDLKHHLNYKKMIDGFFV